MERYTGYILSVFEDGLDVPGVGLAWTSFVLQGAIAEQRAVSVTDLLKPVLRKACTVALALRDTCANLNLKTKESCCTFIRQALESIVSVMNMQYWKNHYGFDSCDGMLDYEQSYIQSRGELALGRKRKESWGQTL